MHQFYISHNLISLGEGVSQKPKASGPYNGVTWINKNALTLPICELRICSLHTNGVEFDPFYTQCYKIITRERERSLWMYIELKGAVEL